MFVLRLTSNDGVRGLESDDGFTIGSFTTSTAALLAITAFMGAVAGMVRVLSVRVLPGRAGRVAFGVVGGLVGGALIVHRDGVDFTLLSPPELAIALFVAIPVVGAWCVALLVDRWTVAWPGWSVRRRALSLLPAAPWAAFVPVALVTAASALAVDAVGRGRYPPVIVRAFVVVARVVLVVVAAVCIRDLTGDTRALVD
jgi:hypothetical protein